VAVSGNSGGACCNSDIVVWLIVLGLGLASALAEVECALLSRVSPALTRWRGREVSEHKG